MIHYCTLYHYDIRNMFTDELASILMCNVICIPSVMPLLGSYIYIATIPTLPAIAFSTLARVALVESIND